MIAYSLFWMDLDTHVGRSQGIGPPPTYIWRMYAPGSYIYLLNGAKLPDECLKTARLPEDCAKGGRGSIVGVALAEYKGPQRAAPFPYSLTFARYGYPLIGLLLGLLVLLVGLQVAERTNSR